MNDTDRALSDLEKQDIAKQLFEILGGACPYCKGKGKIYNLELYKQILAIVKNAKK